MSESKTTSAGSPPKGWRQREKAAQARRDALKADMSIRAQRARLLEKIRRERDGTVEELPNPLSVQSDESAGSELKAGDQDGEGALVEE